MTKALKAIHTVLLLMLLLYCGLALEQFLTKLIDPGNQSLKYWEPGIGVALVAVAFMALLAILGCATGIVKNPSWSLTAVLQGIWLICFTWFGWSHGGPFRLQELVGINFDDPAAVRRAELVHLMAAAAVYLVMVIVVGLPVILRWRQKGRNSSPRNKEKIGRGRDDHRLPRH